MKKRLVLTVGSQMMGDDAAGPLLAQRLRHAPVEGWEALDGGSAPENCLHQIRERAPAGVLVVDAADMDLPPGEIRRIEVDQLDDPYLLSTHSLPLSYLVRSLRESVPKVELVGIQPRVVAFGYPVSPEVKRAVRRVYEALEQPGFAWELL
jgi:hydrogenase 3 maturation protease